jgi:hypothetical protein
MTFCGQASTHRTHPLHRAVSITIAPFIFAIIILYFRIEAAKLYIFSEPAKKNAEKMKKHSFSRKKEPPSFD